MKVFTSLTHPQIKPLSRTVDWRGRYMLDVRALFAIKTTTKRRSWWYVSQISSFILPGYYFELIVCCVFPHSAAVWCPLLFYLVFISAVTYIFLFIKQRNSPLETLWQVNCRCTKRANSDGNTRNLSLTRQPDIWGRYWVSPTRSKPESQSNHRLCATSVKALTHSTTRTPAWLQGRDGERYSTRYPKTGLITPCRPRAACIRISTHRAGGLRPPRSLSPQVFTLPPLLAGYNERH